MPWFSCFKWIEPAAEGLLTGALMAICFIAAPAAKSASEPRLPIYVSDHVKCAKLNVAL